MTRIFTIISTVAAASIVAAAQSNVPQHAVTAPLNIVTTANPCRNGGHKCGDGICVYAKRICDYTPDCSDHSDEKNCGPCDFETDNCGWTDFSTGRYNWTLTSGLSTAGKGPTADHTMRTNKGHYMYVEGSNAGVYHNTAVLQSPPLTAPSKFCQMFFYQNINGKNAGTLQVGTLVNGTFQLIDTYRTSLYYSTTAWYRRIVYLGRYASLPNGYKVQFRVLPAQGDAGSHSSDVVIDDISFNFCDPKKFIPSLHCNFERNLCAWAQSQTDQFDWQRKSGSTNSVGRGPQNDHTTGRNGHYIYIETSAPRRNGDLARLQTPLLPPTPPDGHCFSFWYYMFGPTIGNFTIRLSTTSNSSVFWSKSGPQVDKWIKGQRTLVSNTDYTVYIEATVGNGYQGDIALDDFTVVKGACPPILGCDFEQGFCNWQQSLQDEFNWTIGNNGTPSIRTGPRYDHTFGSDTGHYAYTESSTPQLGRGDRAILISPTYAGQQNDNNNYINYPGSCLTFWYHMFGNTVGSLNVYQKENGTLRQQLWYLNGDQGNAWKKARVSITPQDKSFQIQIEAVKGASYNGYIAIDDIVWIDGICPPPGYCNFETDMCGYSNVQTGDDFDWLRDYGGSPSSSTGPSSDHTKRSASGYYMYIETSGANRKPGQKARLVSEHLHAGNIRGGCVRFYYYMYGAGVRTLNVYTQQVGSNYTKRVWSLSGNQGNDWNLGEAVINQASDYDVIFEGVYGGNYTGDIAIDDLSVSNYICYGATTTRTTPTTVTSPPTYPPTKIDCDFEMNTCDWTQDTKDSFDWTRNAGETSSSYTGPTADHTRGDYQGHYMYTEVSSKPPNSKARLISASWTIPSQGSCFKFWYYMHGADINRLNVYARNGGRETRLWTRAGDQGAKWRYAQVFMKGHPGPTAVVIEGLAGASFTGDIAIDDVSMNVDHCPAQASCDFQEGTCGYTQDYMDNFDWTRQEGSTSSAGTRPIIDHTFGTRHGFYMYTETSGRSVGDKARLDSPQLDPTTGSCLQFWYNMNGRNMGSLNVYRRQGTNLGTPVWTKSGNQNTDWNLAQVNLHSTIPFQFTFEGTVRGYSSDIAIDDIWYKKSVPCPQEGNCAFENDFCTWVNYPTNDTFDWLRGNGGTLSSNTGPSVDHTLNSRYGSYAYLEAPSSRRIGDKAWLVSTSLNKTAKCLSFWYNMHGAGMGTLNVNLWPNSGDTSTLWTKSMDSGDHWYLARVSVKTQTVNYRIIFEGIVGASILSDMAIDDIVLQTGDCISLPTPTPFKTCAFHCPTVSTCVGTLQTCDFNADCPNGEEETACGYNCNFDNGTCKWTTPTNSGFSWSRYHGATPTSNTGPSTDHTLGSSAGYYMYVNASKGYTNQRADFVSPVLQQSSATCQLSYWYHMYGTGIGTMEVYQTEGTLRTRIWYTTGNHGNRWYQAIIPIGRIQRPFQVSLEASRSFGVLGDIAIDDIKFQNCDIPTVQSCTNTRAQFHCNNNACINPNRKCDFTDDCGDGSDEATKLCSPKYIGCTFENSICMWTQMKNDDFDWSRRAGPTASSSTGPSKDHTLNTIAGHYAYIETSSPRTQGDKARIASMVFGPSFTIPYCTMRFYYLMYGKDVSTLSVYTRTSVNGPLSRVWHRTGEVGNFWTRAETQLYSTKAFQVVFEATVGGSYYSEIAIDDISFTPQCTNYTGAFPTVLLALSTPSTPSPCGVGKFQCAHGIQCILSTQVCDFINQCNDASDERNCGKCNFETGLCGWNDISVGRYKWERHNGSTPAQLTGPHYDHTKDTSGIGNYMFVDSSKGDIFGDALMQSPVFGQIGSRCQLNFWFHKGGNQDSGVMRLFLVPPGMRANSQSGRLLIWSALGNKGNNWNNVSVGTGPRKPGYRLAFEAIHIQQSGDIAIDDITLSNCAMGSSMSSCSSNQFHCKSGSCIDKTRLCDYQNDCGDWSDEVNCGNYVERCNFKTDLCDWIQDKTDDFDWQRTRGRTMTVGTGPGTDHTSGNETGYYIFIEASAPRKPNDTARIISPIFLPTTSGSCSMRFFYHMYGKHINALTLYMETAETGGRSVIWSRQNSQDDAWMRADIILTSQKNFRLVIEAKRGTGYLGDIGIDDTSFTPGCQLGLCGTGRQQCSSGQCVTAGSTCNFRKDCSDGSDEASCPHKCDFENGNLCQWTNQQAESTINWTISSKGKPAQATGPATDHTIGQSTGHYAIVANSGLRYMEKAYLVSPQFSQGGPSCDLAFWYALGGRDISSFNLYVRSGGTDKSIWHMPNAPKPMNTWYNVTVALPTCSSQFKLAFKAVAFRGSVSYIAIDDLAFQNCGESLPQSQCLHGQYRCTSGHCVPQNLKCDYQTDCCDGSDETPNHCSGYYGCSFEQGMCGWIQNTNDNFNWTRRRGKTNSLMTGPTTDHTSHSEVGYYVYIESSTPQKPNDTARIYYPLPTSNGLCAIRFWYHMYGSDIGALNVYMRTFQGMKLLSSTTGQQGNLWKRQEISLTSTAPFEVVIEGVIGVGYKGDIAIDDISFTPGCGVGIPSTGVPPTHPAAQSITPQQGFTGTPCQNNQFTCMDGSCVDPSKVCDFTPDCSDSGDEKGCPLTCGFDRDLCGWNNTNPDKLNWKRSSGASTVNMRTMAPQYDSTSSLNGCYVFIHDQTGGKPSGNQAVLTSPTYNSASAQCKVQFHYFMQGPSVGTLRLTVTQAGMKVTLWQDQGDHGSNWQSTAVGIGRRNTRFTLAFEKANSYMYHGAIAVDQLQFQDCGRPQPQQFCNSVTQFTCVNKACISLTRKCDIADDCGDHSDEEDPSCKAYKRFDFEQDFGDLTQGNNGVDDNFDWIRWNGSTQSINSGPDRDHSTGLASGHYLYMEASAPHKYNQKTWLLTKPFKPTMGKNCHMRFYYYMYGNFFNQLNIYSRIYNSGTLTRLMWSVAGNQGAVWQRADIFLNSSNSFQVIIEANIGDSYIGDIAIDDVSFTPDCQYSGQSLPTPPVVVSASTLAPQTTAPHTCDLSIQYNCRSTGKCINKIKQCDFRKDCSDGSDEDSCGQTITPVTKTRPPMTTIVTAGSNLCPDGQFMCANHQCITTRLLCDGVSDCPDGSDENQCEVGCDVNSFFCKQKGLCMTRFVLCDILIDCPLHAGDHFGQDESSCSQCPPYYCLNGGTCSVKPNDSGPVCNCSTGYSGFRCQISSVKPVSTQATRNSSGSPNTDFRQAVHLQCIHQGWFVTVELNKLSPRPRKVTDIYIGTEACTGSAQGDLLVFNQTYGLCNTRAQVTDVKMTFTNKLLYVPELNHAIDDIGWEYNMQCSRSRYANATVQIIQTGNVTKQGSSGSIIDISVFKDANFREPLQGIITSGPTMYVQLVSLTPLDVVMVLDSCEASVQPSNTSDQKSISLIEKHCSVDQTTNILIVRSEVIRFQFDLVYPPRDMEGISITCDVHFCDQSDLSHTCDQTCRVNPAVIG